MSQITVIIPNFNGARYLRACLVSLAKQTRAPWEILVVDNASTDNSLEVIAGVDAQVRVVTLNKNLGFAAGVNAGVRAAQSEWVAVLNNDTDAAPGWLAACAAATERYPEAAFLACRVLDLAARDRMDSAGDCFLRAGMGYRRGHGAADCPDYHEDVEVFSACGCAAVYRKSVFEKTGGYDPDFFAYLEDLDLGFRLRAAGYRGYYVAGAKVYHHGGGTSGGEFSSLSVRLRTRNSLLLLLKNYPFPFLWRCSPMILLLQLSWLARAVAHGKFLSYLRGLGGTLPMLPAALRARRTHSMTACDTANALWRAILLSEDTARRDFTSHAGSRASTFLHWYFRLF